MPFYLLLMVYQLVEGFLCLLPYTAALYLLVTVILKHLEALFEEKRKLAKCRNMSHFIRKCVLEKEIYQVDLEPFRDLQGLLRGATNNINQIAKRVNSTGVIYKEDIDDIKNEIEHFSKELWQIHSLLLNRTSGDD